MSDLGGKTFEDLTKRQKMIMHAIRDLTAVRGYPPTLREIAKEVGLASPSSVVWQLQTLEEKGLIRRDLNSSRGIVLAATPPAHAGGSYFRITCEDLETGDKETAEIAEGDYMLIPTGSCYLDGVTRLANGTVQLTIRGHQPSGLPREAS